MTNDMITVYRHPEWMVWVPRCRCFIWHKDTIWAVTWEAKGTVHPGKESIETEIILWRPLSFSEGDSCPFIHSFLFSANCKNLRSQIETFLSPSPINTADMPASSLFISWVAFLNLLHCFFPTMFSQEIITKEAKVMYNWTHFRKTVSISGIQANCWS